MKKYTVFAIKLDSETCFLLFPASYTIEPKTVWDKLSLADLGGTLVEQVRRQFPMYEVTTRLPDDAQIDYRKEFGSSV